MSRDIYHIPHSIIQPFTVDSYRFTSLKSFIAVRITLKLFFTKVIIRRLTVPCKFLIKYMQICILFHQTTVYDYFVILSVLDLGSKIVNRHSGMSFINFVNNKLP